MRHHAAQLAREAGHPIRIAAIDKDKWMEASRHGFLTGDHRGMAAVLSAAAVKCDLAPEERIGPAGDRKTLVTGKSVSVRVDHGGRRILKKKKNRKKHTNN